MGKIRTVDILWKAILGLVMLPIVIKYLCFASVFFMVAIILAYNFPDRLFNKHFIWITASFILALVIITSLILVL